MKEFDFDELDRAVNSLMADVKKTEPATPAAPQASTTPASTPISVPTPVTSPEVSTPEVSVPTPSLSEPTPGATPTVAPSPTITTPEPIQSNAMPTPSSERLAPRIAPQRSGRFMDVVHPSSDMKSSQPATRPASQSREGVSIQPASQPTGTTGPTASSTPVVDVVAPAIAPAPVPKTEPPVAEKAEAAPIEQPVSEPWTSSPFLADAQVEKRPLGGAQTTPPETGLSEAIAAELSKSPSEANDISDSSVEASAPRDEEISTELPKDIEVDDITTEEPTATSESDEKKDDTQLEASPQKEIAMPAELDTNLVAIESGQIDASGGVSNSSPAAVLTTSSIPQQYDEQPTSGDTSHTPIYDNESVHQPLAHPAKKKSGWMMVVFIIGILVIGGALGAGAYFLGLI